MTYMLREVHQQPEIIRVLARLESDNIARLAREIRERDIRLIITVARGSSHHAAVYAKYLFETINGIPVAHAEPSVYTLYGAQLDLERTLVLAISQSGEGLDSGDYLLRAKSQGAFTAAIANDPGSRITTIADSVIFCHAEKEISLAATKTYTSALAAICLLSAELAGDQRQAEAVLTAADKMDEVLALEPQLADLGRGYADLDRCSIISRGINLCTAMESSLKMIESSYIGAQAYSAASFMHGPVAAVSETSTCFLLAPDGAALDSILVVADTARERRADSVIFAADDAALARAQTGVRMPSGIDEIVSPLPYITAVQIFANYLAEAKGCDPDHPRGLTKVILTR
jgi:glutamine---fructose-6-phosphate transaminase (isomerizing)